MGGDGVVNRVLEAGDRDQRLHVFIGIVVVVGSIYYFTVYNRKPIQVLAEHAAEVPALPGAAMGEMAP